MRLLFLLACLTLAAYANNLNKLKPCFERYTSHRLANAKPYHSEYRMPSEEHCLLFCAQTASRCRSIVFESSRHLCHFFLSDSEDDVIFSPRMTYFKVVEKQCLESVVSSMESDDQLQNVAGNQIAATPEDIRIPTSTHQPYTAPSAPVTHPPTRETTTTTRLTTTTTKKPTTEFVRATSEETLDYIDDSSRPVTIIKTEEQFDLPQVASQDKFSSDTKFIALPPLRPTMSPSELESQLEAEAFSADSLDSAELKTLRQIKVPDAAAMPQDGMAVLTTPPPTPPTAFPTLATVIEAVTVGPAPEVDAIVDEVRRTKAELERKLAEKMEKLKKMYPEKYRQLVSSGEARVAPSGEREGLRAVVPVEPTTTQGPVVVAKSPSTYEKTKTLSPRVLKFDEDRFMKKSEIRKSPRRGNAPSSASAEELAPKIQSFLDTLNDGEAAFDTPIRPSEASLLKNVPKLTVTKKNKATPPPVVNMDNACPPGESPVWISFSNTVLSTGEGERLPTEGGRTECEAGCGELETCMSYTFHDPSSECSLNMDSDPLLLKGAGAEVASTSVKFCYDEELTPLRECGVFEAFHEYTMKTPAREQFDGLPASYEGMHMCVELCALSTDYLCKSATFQVSTGRCRLIPEDSLSKPSDFAEADEEGVIYFENGCSRIRHLNEKERSAVRVERVLAAVEEKEMEQQLAQVEEELQKTRPVEKNKPSKRKQLKAVKIRPLREQIKSLSSYELKTVKTHRGGEFSLV